jgi:hypothetical protein
MAKRRSTARRAAKRSAKRFARRNAYKSRKTHLKSRGRKQVGGQKMGSFPNFSAAKVLLQTLSSILTIIPKIYNAVFSMMVMVYILSTIAKNPMAFANTAYPALKTKLDNKLNDLNVKLKGIMGERTDELNKCIDTFTTKIRNNPKVQQPSLPDINSDVGKACIYDSGIPNEENTTGKYQALIVDEWDEKQASEKGYGQEMYLIWVKGGSLFGFPVLKSTISIVSEDSAEFTGLARYNIGQERDTIEQARAYHILSSSPSTDNTNNDAPPEQEESLYEMLQRRTTEFSAAQNKKQFIVDAVNGYIETSKLRLKRITERFQDEELKQCIQLIKDELTKQIKTQVTEMINKLNSLKI